MKELIEMKQRHIKMRNKRKQQSAGVSSPVKECPYTTCREVCSHRRASSSQAVMDNLNCQDAAELLSGALL